MAVLQQYLVLKRDVEELEEGTIVSPPAISSGGKSRKAKGKARAKAKGEKA